MEGQAEQKQTVEPLPEKFEAKLTEIVPRYPRKKSAVMPALYLAQEHYGWISPEAINWVAARLDLPAAHVVEVATFYTMYYKKPVGRYHVQLCRTLSCALCGAKKLRDYLAQRLKVGPQTVAKSGLWSYEEVECLGSCGTAPMVQINDVFFEALTPEQLGQVMDRIEQELPDLRYSTAVEELGRGLPDHLRSKVLERQKMATKVETNGAS